MAGKRGKMFNVAIIGQSQVGKTNLLLAFKSLSDDPSDSQNRETTPTIGFFQKPMKFNKIEYNFIDLGGQQAFSGNLGTILAISHIVIVVFDITDPENVLEEHVDKYFVENINAKGEPEGRRTIRGTPKNANNTPNNNNNANPNNNNNDDQNGQNNEQQNNNGDDDARREGLMPKDVAFLLVLNKVDLIKSADQLKAIEERFKAHVESRQVHGQMLQGPKVFTCSAIERTNMSQILGELGKIRELQRGPSKKKGFPCCF